MAFWQTNERRRNRPRESVLHVRLRTTGRRREIRRRILLAGLAPGDGLSTAIIAMTLVLLGLLGAIAGRLGGASMAKGAARPIMNAAGIVGYVYTSE